MGRILEQFSGLDLELLAAVDAIDERTGRGCNPAPLL